MLIMLCLFAARAAHALPLEELVGAERATLLRAEGGINRTGFDKPSPELMPNHPRLEALMALRLQELKPTVISESLELYTKPAGAQKQRWTAAERAALYNQVLALSTLSGLEYFSRRRNKMHTFYESSYIVEGPAGKTPQSDPVYATPPETLTLYARQNDTKFGSNMYEFTFYAESDALLIAQENTAALTLLFVPVIGKRELHSLVALIDAGPYLLVYAASLVKTATIPGLKSQMSASINNRAEALIQWFFGRADIAYQQKAPAAP